MERDMINRLMALSHERKVIKEDYGANLRCKE